MKTITAQSEVGLSENKSINKIRSQRTQEAWQQNSLIITKELKAGGSRYDSMPNYGEQIEGLKRSVLKWEDKLLQYILHSPIVQKHERTPSFMNKLPIGLKNLIHTNEGSGEENNLGSNKRYALNSLIMTIVDQIILMPNTAIMQILVLMLGLMMTKK